MSSASKKQDIVSTADVNRQQKQSSIQQSIQLNQKSYLGELTEKNNDIGELIRLQTDKCYQRIPKLYFDQQMEGDIFNGLITRDRAKVAAQRQEMTDYYDEVEFNVNQQVAYKLSIFMSFVSYLTSIGKLADVSIGKIRRARDNNVKVKERLIQRGLKITILRGRKQQIQLTISALKIVKKLKKLQDSFMSQVHVKGKISTLSSYPQYCILHQQIKGYCCPRTLCKYWDVAYYIERGYHDSFTRSLKNYLTEIVMIDEKHIREIVFPNKNLFSTASTGSRQLSSLSDPSITLDQSFQLEEEDVELVNKHNIEREIVSIYKQGLNKCSYSTDQLCEQLRAVLQKCENHLYQVIKGENGPSEKELTAQAKRLILQKLTTGKYVKLVEHWSDRMKKVVKRQFAVIERALRSTADIKQDFPQKYEVMCSYLMQIIYITMAFTDQSLSFLLNNKKIRQHEAESIRQVLLKQDQWKEIVLELRHSHHIWYQLQMHFADGMEGDQRENIILQGLVGHLRNSRRKMVETMINGYNNASLETLEKSLQEENWKITTIPSKFYRVLGQVLFGQPFIRDLQQIELNMLSSSLLLDKNSSTYSMSHSEIFNEQEKPEAMKSFEKVSTLQNICLSETIVRIKNKQFKLLSSTMTVVQSLQGYLQWIDDYPQSQRTQVLILKKIEEFLLVYSNYLKDLILNKGALGLGKIKSKSITGKHLLVAYGQLKFMCEVSKLLASRYTRYEEGKQSVHEKLEKHLSELSKKFRSILQLSIRESINKMVVDPRKQISWPVPQSSQIVCALTKSCDLVKEILIDDNYLGEFISICWCPQYLQKLRGQYKSVYRVIMNSNGTRKGKDIDWSDNIYWKYKELDYMVTNLIEIGEYLAGFSGMGEELELQRKKLSNPN